MAEITSVAAIALQARHQAGVEGGLAFEDWTEGIVARVAEAVEDGIEYDELHDLAHEIADNAVPIYTADLMTLGCASLDLATYVADLGEPTNAAEALQFACYEVACIVAHCAIEDLTRQPDSDTIQETA